MRARLRRDALAILQAGLARVDPAMAVGRALKRRDDGTLRLAPAPPGRLRVLAVGKAASAMTLAFEPDDLSEPGLVVTTDGTARDLPGFRVLAAGHPVPDARSAVAAAEVERFVAGTGAADTLLVLLSGGGSSLLAAPDGALTVEDLAETNRVLLASGADIHAVNTVRKHLSRLKGGRLARLARAARVVVLLISDVPGDVPRAVASGPFAAEPSSPADALGVIAERGLREALPAGVIAHLARPSALPPVDDPCFERVDHRVVASNAHAVAGARDTARRLGHVLVRAPALEGEAREMGRALASTAPGPGGALVAGGETTVTLRGGGRGGRCQELALSFALEAEARGLEAPWVLMAAGTDGRDGPTDAAGGLVDDGTLARCRAAGVDPAACLDDNDAYRALAASGDLLRLGVTGTNVADLLVLLR